MIKVIYFDFFNVLCTPPYSPTIRKFAPIESQKYLLDKLDPLDLGQISEDDFMVEISKISKVDKNIIENSVNSVPVFNDELEEFIITSLISKYKIGLLTNAHKTMIDRLLKSQKMFDLVIISSEVKMLKPNKDIFELAIKLAEVPPEEILFVDDTIQNIEVAQSLGIQTIHYLGLKEFISEIKKMI